MRDITAGTYGENPFRYGSFCSVNIGKRGFAPLLSNPCARKAETCWWHHSEVLFRSGGGIPGGSVGTQLRSSPPGASLPSPEVAFNVRRPWVEFFTEAEPKIPPVWKLTERGEPFSFLPSFFLSFLF